MARLISKISFMTYKTSKGSVVNMGNARYIGQKTAIKLMAAMVLLAGLSGSGCSTVSKSMRSAISRADKQYDSSNYLVAEGILNRALVAEPNSPAAGEAYYIRGLCHLKQGSIDQGKADLQLALKRAKRKDLKINTLTCLGTIAYERGDWQGACQYWQQVANKLPKVAPNHWVLYRLGIALQKVGKWDEARKYFGKIIHEYGGTDVARKANGRLKYEYFSVQAGAFAQSRRAGVLASKLRNAGFKARIAGKYSSGKRLSIVSVGRYPNYNLAASMLRRVRHVVPDAAIMP